MSLWHEISVNDMDGFAIGNAEYEEAGTGCTVILPKGRCVCGQSVSGGAPASRESALLNPLAANDNVNAVLLSGGSAFGLNAASGVVKYLEERGIGFPTSSGPVPIVCASCIFDLGVGRADIRPDEALGYQACLNAGNYKDGNHGAGTGASVGKLLGPDHMTKSGIGSFALQLGDLKIGAVVSVNAAGNVLGTDGKDMAGVRNENGSVMSGVDAMCLALSPRQMENTTICAVMTNASFDKTACTKIAHMADDGYARALNPVHTMYDGDTIYVMSSGDVRADLNLVGTLSALAVSEAICNAARHAEDAYGIPAMRK